MVDNIDKTSIAGLLFNYLGTTHPVMLFVHLIWLALVCTVLSMTYIVSFHTTDLLTIYDQIHKAAAKP